MGPRAGVTATAPVDATARLTATASPVGESAAPTPPRPVVFSPGETISADDVGRYIVAPGPGAAEGWGTSPDHRCESRSATTDGRKLLFACDRQEPGTPAGTQSPGQPTSTYVLDTVTGDWFPLVIPADSYGIVSPQGETLTRAAIGAMRSVMTSSPGVLPLMERWAPDGSGFIVTFGARGDDNRASASYLIRMDRSQPIQLADSGSVHVALPEHVEIAWSPDSSKVAFVSCCDQPTTDAISVFDGLGRKLWSRDAPIYHGNPRWSPDSQWLGVQVRRSVPSTQLPDPAYDLSVFDGASGEAAFRLLGAIACAGEYWTADNRLTVGAYTAAAGEVVVDPRARTLTNLDSYVTPSPTDPNLGVSFDGNDFYAVNLKDGSKHLIAHTTVRPAWDFLHEPLFAGSRIMFRSKELGHGGCAEGSPPSRPPRLELQFPPFPNE